MKYQPNSLLNGRLTLLAGFLWLLCSSASAIRAQQPLPQGEIAPNEEASSYDTLMDRSDLGNVAQTARMQLDTGLRELSQAQKLEKKAAETTDPEKREKAENKVIKAAERADQAFREALGFNANLTAAYAGLGAALRLQGKPEEALQVYALALRRSPDDLENFQGWSETLLELDMLGNATSAYTKYSQSSPERAKIMMAEIKKWLAEKQARPGELDPQDVQRLASWVEQQSQG